MNQKRAGRPTCRSPEFPSQNAEVQSVELWGQRAGNTLKDLMATRGWTFRELSEQLATAGIVMSAPAVNRRINRGNFSAGFLLMCVDAMGAKLEVQVNESTPQQAKAKKVSGNPAKVKKPVDELEDVMGTWGNKK